MPSTTNYNDTQTLDTTDAQLPITDLAWLTKGAQFPPASQTKRMERYRVNRALWKGEHDEVYGDWWKVLRDDKAATLEIVLNWHKRLSTLWADLLLSETPRFFDGQDPDRSADPDSSTEAGPLEAKGSQNARQEAIDRITSKDDNGYVRTLYKVALDISRYGDGLVKLSLVEDGARLKAYPPSYWFPVVDPNDLTEFTHHVLAWKFRRTDMTFLRCEIHHKGRVEHRVYHLEGNMIGEQMPIESFSTIPGGTQETNLDDFLVVPFKGLEVSDEIFGSNDYESIDSVIQALEVRCGQINRVLDKHTDPSMYGPPNLMERDSAGNWVFKAGGRYYEVDEDDVPPGYVTWDGQLEAQFKEIETLLTQLYILSETSPAAFGQIEGNLAESGSALRRLMQAPLAKVARMTMSIDPAAKRCIRLAAQLEAKNGHATPDITHVNIQWQDGLPPDPKEQAETEHFRKAALNTSTVSSIRRLDGGTQEEAEAEYARIQAEAQEAADMQMQVAEHDAKLKERQSQASGNTPGKEGAVKTSEKNKETK